ncbi:MULTISPECIES: acyl-CoA thioesterase [Falsiroseomonas]|uniref:4-hydroxybenzoyl-CoA thioesterase n=1 Tax=Falsiroseomonas stagni DSM 19981 TaxID=1123062 RepID=A0A1I3ZM98_9PROT|nr:MULTISPECIES: acyl-CoA thioesterase [Acetobacteraceae]SFK45182.1 4-hydroxybenzoyl-CoA thioesterase [Falsiroseomonas stagni DSM 19981]
MTSLVNRRPVTIEWGDCDPAGIVFYPRYFAIFDACTAALFQAALGMPKIQWTEKFGIVGIPMVDTRGKFSVPSAYGDEVVVESRITAFRRSSFDVEHRLLKADGALGVEGFETRVWVARDPNNPKGIKAAPIPAEVVAAFGA